MPLEKSVRKNELQKLINEPKVEVTNYKQSPDLHKTLSKMLPTFLFRERRQATRLIDLSESPFSPPSSKDKQKTDAKILTNLIKQAHFNLMPSTFLFFEVPPVTKEKTKDMAIDSLKKEHCHLSEARAREQEYEYYNPLTEVLSADF